MVAYLRSWLICSVILFVVQQPLSSSLKLEELNEIFKKNQKIWAERDCVFPSPPDYIADQITGTFTLKACSSAEELPTESVLKNYGLQLCSLFFNMSQILCDQLDRDHWKDKAAQLINGMSDVCNIAREKFGYAQLISFMTVIHDQEVCKKLCVEDEKMAPVCRLLVAAVAVFEMRKPDATKEDARNTTHEAISGTRPPQEEISTVVPGEIPPTPPEPPESTSTTTTPPESTSTTTKPPESTTTTTKPPESTTTTTNPPESTTTTTKPPESTTTTTKPPESTNTSTTPPKSTNTTTTPPESTNTTTTPPGSTNTTTTPPKDNKKIGPSTESSEEEEEVKIPMEEKIPSSGQFMAYFVAALVLVIAAYVVYHYRRKIMGYIMEGSPSERHRHSPASEKGDSKVKYSKLNSSAEEILPSYDRSATTCNYIY